MKKIIMAAAIVGCTFFLSSCSTTGGDPKTTLITFFETLGKKDIAGARKLATESSKGMLDMIEMGLKNNKGEKGLEKFEIGRAHV